MFSMAYCLVSQLLAACIPRCCKRHHWVCLSSLVLLLHSVTGDEYLTFSLSSAVINITYHNPVTDSVYSEVNRRGTYGSTSRLSAELGTVVHLKTPSSTSTSGICVEQPSYLPAERWIALVEEGPCKVPKLLNAAAVKNASAVVIYSIGDDLEHELQHRKHKADEMVHVFVTAQFGEHVAALVDNGTRVYMQISVSRQEPPYYTTINKTSMLFLSISFIVLMIISLAWLIFYYVQRSRYTYAKQRLSKRLMSAAKKAISKMPLRTVRSGDEEMETGFDLCAVCIEGYRSCDVVRILPCKHVFHKSCIDPWLIEHRSCPICKIDILKAYGLQICRSRESALNVEPDVVSTSFAFSEYISPDGGMGRDFDSDGVEIVRFQLAHIEYHLASSDAAASTSRVEQEPRDTTAAVPITTEAAVNVSCPPDDDNLQDSIDELQLESAEVSASHPPSIHSLKSEDSETNETQSLMTDIVRSC